MDKQFHEHPVPGFYNLVDGSIKIDNFLSDSEILEFEKNIKVKIIHTPGIPTAQHCFNL